MEGTYNFKNIDQSLDDIIQKNSLSKPNFKAKNRKIDFRPHKSLDHIVRRARQDRKSAEAFVCKSMLISGLAPTVEQDDLERLFKPYGANVKMHYREDGKFFGTFPPILLLTNFYNLTFLGSAEVIAPSFKAAKQIYFDYNQRTLDNYSMKIRFATGLFYISRVFLSLIDQVDQVLHFTEYGETVGRNGDQTEKIPTPSTARGAGFFKGGGGGLKSAEQLDKEMEDYMSQRK